MKPDAGVEMSQLPAREVNGRMLSPLPPVTGEIVDAHYGADRTCEECTYDITVLGTHWSWNAKYSARCLIAPVQKTPTAGWLTSSHPVRVGIQNSNVIRQ